MDPGAFQRRRLKLISPGSGWTILHLSSSG